jgi:hypothetical protein
MSVIFAHDLCKPLGFRWSDNELLISKVFALLSGIAAVVVAVKFKSVLSVVIYAYGVYLAIVSPPFMLAIFGFRSSGKAVMIGMSAGVFALGFFSIFPIENMESYIPGVLANVAFLYGSHYLLKQPGGWVGIKDKKSFENFGGDIETLLLNIKIKHSTRVFGKDPKIRKLITMEDIKNAYTEFLKIRKEKEIPQFVKDMYT